MIWTRKLKAQNAHGLAEASARMMQAITTGQNRGMAWIDFLAASAADEAAKLESENDNEAWKAPERGMK